jgi:hypothetical protein
MLKNPVVCKDSEYLAVWIYLLLSATHFEYPELFKGKKITLKPGQLITGRKTISLKFDISESKVQRILKTLEIEHQIEQQTSNENRLITILNWNEYQESEQQNELPVNNERTTSEQRVNTYKNNKNIKNDKNNKNSHFTPPSLGEVQVYCRERNNQVDAEQFINHYTANGWIQGRGKPIKDWKAAVRTWERNDFNKPSPAAQPRPNKFNNYPQRQYTQQDYAAIEKKLRDKQTFDT